MNELSLHILDITQNSISAKASHISIIVEESTIKDTLSISIIDDGCGMTPEFLQKVTDPFTTSRKTRKVGLGIPLLKFAAESTDGSFNITSQPGKGTSLTAVFTRSHIDRAPLGDMAVTMMQLIMSAPDIDFIYKHSLDDNEFVLDTAKIREIMEGIPIDSPDVLEFIRQYVSENETELGGT